MSVVEEIALAKLADLVFKAAEVGLNRLEVIGLIDKMEAEGKSKTEIYVALKDQLDQEISKLINAHS